MRARPVAVAGASVALFLTASCAFRGAPAPGGAFPSASAFRPASSCRECHAAIYAEWDASAHAHAWENPVIRASSGNFERPGCRNCHSPEPVLMSDLSQQPVYRDHHQEESISCVSCHQTVHGMAAPRPCDSAAPCRPCADARLASVEACGICHDLTHDTVKEWRGTVFERRGITCVVCHMPEEKVVVTEGLPARTARSHRFPGRRDPPTLRQGIRSEFAVADGKLAVTVSNLCGHKFPGEFRSREFHVVLLQWKGEDLLREDRTLLKQSERFEAVQTDNRLKPEETRTFSAPLDPAARRAEVKLLYKPGPGLLDSEAVELATWSTDLGGL